MSESKKPLLEETPALFDDDVQFPLFTPERIWISVLSLLCAGIIAGSIVYSLDNFNVAEQAHSWQAERTQVAVEQFTGALRNQIMMSGSDDMCTVDNVLLIHTSGNAYNAYVDYSYTPVDVSGVDRNVDFSRMVSFQCQMTVTTDGQSHEWNLNPINPGCGFGQVRSRTRLACFGQ